MQNNLIGFASDGAASNLGRLNGIIKHLKVSAKNSIFSIHCMAHRLELTILHAFDSFNHNQNMNAISFYLDKVVRKTYSFYNKHGFKRKNHLKEKCKKMNRKFYALNKMIETRWVVSDFNALKSIDNMWPALIQDLNEIVGDSANFLQKAKSTAKKRISEPYMSEGGG